ncbi:TadE/TadG family type IV pilus assembly protein [Burkholderia sp. 8Y]|uniref:TadE/TadG family type IV pilus assembly protein n=1 Tax=Burkholderia sp. 8Y TaxID=2653133 RepID=UPI0022A6E2A6|nr:TadE/TadG family type IV pilus assembly protein [Burkholderia sp. 8Y]
MRVARHGRRQSGSIVIEFVILLPFLLMVLFGIIDASALMYDKAALTNAARTAARAGTCLSVPPLTVSQITAVANTALQGSLLSGNTSDVATVSVDQSSGTATGSPLTVTLSYSYQGLFMGSALTTITGPIVLSATAVMNYE